MITNVVIFALKITRVGKKEDGKSQHKDFIM